MYILGWYKESLVEQLFVPYEPPSLNKVISAYL